MLDPVTRLPNRAEFQAYLNSELVSAVENQEVFGLMLINPDEFALVNERLGRSIGDSVLVEFSSAFSSCLRETDKAFHFGGAILAGLIRLKDGADGLPAVERVRSMLEQRDYSNGAVNLRFSAGSAVFDGTHGPSRSVDADELIRRADWSLAAAKARGGARTLVWSADAEERLEGDIHQLATIYTGDTRRDYRNMLLLWDTVQMMSGSSTIPAIAAEFSRKVSSAFNAESVAVLGESVNGIPEVVAESGGFSADFGRRRLHRWFLDKVGGLLAEVEKTLRPARVRMPGDGEGDVSLHQVHVIPLVARDAYLGCLWLEGEETQLVLDSTDILFLNALARQIAIAVDRAQILARWQREKERETSWLRGELKDLRRALNKPKLVAQSKQMKSILEDLERVARTDATVLIQGSSGTGKELLAGFVHEHSLRADGPFITVDCGAIAPTLIEAELFGHRKGAYTGADAKSAGRVALAKGGTVFLDEIGELPLGVQTKLLRFVQEKEITAVGGSKTSKVDVRIVAATNRDLRAEVAAGRFREDLFYRLQVVTIIAPPLGERTSDILPLARYFMKIFSEQYKTRPLTLSREAETALVEYPWPGNVRELENRILQAVVMSSGDELGVGDLRFPSEQLATESRAGKPPQIDLDTGVELAPSPERPTSSRSSAYGSDTPPPSDSEDPWCGLQEVLRWVVDVLAWRVGEASKPLGLWLVEDIVLAADEAAGGVASRGSSLLGMPESTYRRQLGKARESLEAGTSVRIPEWLAVHSLFSALLTSGEQEAGFGVVSRARQMLLEEVVAQFEDDDKAGAAMMGVTVPTYRSWKAQLAPAGLDRAEETR